MFIFVFIISGDKDVGNSSCTICIVLVTFTNVQCTSRLTARDQRVSILNIKNSGLRKLQTAEAIVD